MKSFILISVLAVVALLGCQKKKSNSASNAAAVLAPAPTPAPLPESGPALPTSPALIKEDDHGLSPALYYVPILNIRKPSCEHDGLQAIKNGQGATIAQLCEAEYKICVKQGTCLLNEVGGLRMIHFSSRRGSVPTLSDKLKKECPYGVGMDSICLDPYFTVAADLKIYKLGDVLFIPTIRGLKLPNGEIHNGYFIVRDSVGDVKEASRFDFFTGFDVDVDLANEFKKRGLDNTENRFKFEKTKEEIAVKVRAQRNYPKITSRQQSAATEFLKKTMTSPKAETNTPGESEWQKDSTKPRKYAPKVAPKLG